MFEALVADLLNKILGDFVENLDAKQLNLSVWVGELATFRSSPRALTFCTYPLLSRRANWARLGSEPVVVIVEDVLVIARLRKNSDELQVDAAEETKVGRVVHVAVFGAAGRHWRVHDE